MSKVYVVTCDIDNCEDYEDHDVCTKVIGVCGSKDIVEKMIQDDIENTIALAKKRNDEYNSVCAKCDMHPWEFICDRNPEGDDRNPDGNTALYLEWEPYRHESYSYYVKECEVMNETESTPEREFDKSETQNEKKSNLAFELFNLLTEIHKLNDDNRKLSDRIDILEKMVK